MTARPDPRCPDCGTKAVRLGYNHWGCPDYDCDIISFARYAEVNQAPNVPSSGPHVPGDQFDSAYRIDAEQTKRALGLSDPCACDGTHTTATPFETSAL